MNDVSGNSPVIVPEEIFEEDFEENGTDETGTEDGTEEIESEEKSDVSDNENENTEEETEDVETVEGENVSDNEEYIFETLDVSDDNISVVTDYTNYFSFLIAVVLGVGAVICWAKGFTE